MATDDNGIRNLVDDIGEILWIDDNGIYLGTPLRTFTIHLV